MKRMNKRKKKPKKRRKSKNPIYFGPFWKLTNLKFIYIYSIVRMSIFVYVTRNMGGWKNICTDHLKMNVIYMQ